MQGFGHLKDQKTGEIILCLVRQGSYGRYLKRRKAGKPGFHLTDEEIFINRHQDIMDQLKNFEKIFV